MGIEAWTLGTLDASVTRRFGLKIAQLIKKAKSRQNFSCLPRSLFQLYGQSLLNLPNFDQKERHHRHSKLAQNGSKSPDLVTLVDVALTTRSV